MKLRQILPLIALTTVFHVPSASAKTPSTWMIKRQIINDKQNIQLLDIAIKDAKNGLPTKKPLNELLRLKDSVNTALKFHLKK